MDTLENLDVNVGDRVVFNNIDNGKQYQYEISNVEDLLDADENPYTRYFGFRLDGEGDGDVRPLGGWRPYWTVTHRVTINKKPQPTFEVIFEDGSTQRFDKRVICVVEYEATDHPVPKTKKVNFLNEKGENS